MANNWPGGGETPLSKTEKWIVGIGGVVLIAGGVGYGVMVLISVLKLHPPISAMIIIWAAALMLALIWVQPWNQTAPVPKPKRPRRRPTP